MTNLKVKTQCNLLYLTPNNFFYLMWFKKKNKEWKNKRDGRLLAPCPTHQAIVSNVFTQHATLRIACIYTFLRIVCYIYIMKYIFIYSFQKKKKNSLYKGILCSPTKSFFLSSCAQSRRGETQHCTVVCSFSVGDLLLYIYSWFYRYDVTTFLSYRVMSTGELVRCLFSWFSYMKSLSKIGQTT